MTTEPHNPPDDDKIVIDKEIDVLVEAEYNVVVDVEITKTVDITADVCVDVNVDGNLAELVFDVEAIGEHTYAQADVFVLAVEDTMSHVGGYMVAGVA